MTSKAAKSVLRVVNCSIHNVPPQNGRIVTNFFEQKVRLLSTSFKSCPFSEHNDQIDSRVSTVSTPVSTSPGMSKSSARMSMRSTSSRLRTRSTSPSFSHLSSSSLELKPPIQSTTNTMNINTDVTMAATTARCPLGFDRSIEKAFNSENSPIRSDQFRLAKTRHLGTKEKVLSFNEIPTAKGFRIFGASWRLISMGGAAFLHKYCDSLHKELGPIYKEKLGPTECIFLADPNMIRQVYQNEGKYPKHLVPEAWLIFNEIKGIKRGLFFMDGPEWEKRRHALNKIFLNKSLVSDYSEAFNQVISDLINGWDQLIPGTKETSLIDNCVSNNGDYLALSDGLQLGRFSNSNPTDKLDGNFGFVDQLEREMYKWSIESLATMVFGRRLGCLTASPTCSKSTGDQKEECVHEFVRCVKDLFVESTKMTVVPAKVVSKLNLPIWKRFMAAAGRALELARGYVEEELVIKRGISSTKSKKSGVLTTLLNKYNIEQDELARIVTDLFLAAADTTSHATQWAFYLLSKHPEVQDKIYQEIKSAVGEDGYIKEEHLKLLPHVRGVIKESLRLYPIAPFLSRILPHDIVLGGYRIPAGTLLCTSLYTTGRDDRFFWDASGFHPERWIRNRSATSPREVINSHASIPFGIGVRGCVGRKVAELQMQLLIARAIQKFHIEPGKEEDIEIKLRMITTPDEKINLKLRRRKADD